MSEIWKYHDRVCESCNKAFRPSIESQSICTQCLIHPYKIPILKEEPMALTKKTKICVFPGCGKEFQPTGNCQKRCPEHIHGKFKTSVPVTEAKPETGKPTQHAVIRIDDSGKILRLLIAAGFVTEEKVQQARALLK
jgi:hypothetical protein